MSLKNSVTTPGIDPGTVRLGAQRLNHYATPGPCYRYSSAKISCSVGNKIQFFTGLGKKYESSCCNVLPARHLYPQRLSYSTFCLQKHASTAFTSVGLLSYQGWAVRGLYVCHYIHALSLNFSLLHQYVRLQRILDDAFCIREQFFCHYCQGFRRVA